MTKQTIPQLTADIKAGRIAPVYFFTGDDAYRKLEFAQKIKEAVAPDEFNFVKEDSSACDIGEIISLANTSPVFSARRVIILNNADKLKKNAVAALAGYVAAPLESTCFVILHNDSKKSKKDREIEDNLSDICSHVNFDELKGPALNGWVTEKFAERGLNAQPAALMALEDIIGADLTALNTEIEKLSLYAQDRADKTISQDDVLASIGFSKEENPFALSNAVLDCNKNLSLKLIDSMLAAGEEPISILNKISSCAVKLLRVKRLASAGLNQYEVVSAAGLMPWEGRLVSRAGQMPSVATLVKALDKIIETDMAFKSSSASDAGIMLKGIILTLFGAK